jgi:hypothetical protein
MHAAEIFPIDDNETCPQLKADGSLRYLLTPAGLSKPLLTGLLDDAEQFLGRLAMLERVSKTMARS